MFCWAPLFRVSGSLSILKLLTQSGDALPEVKPMRLYGTFRVVLSEAVDGCICFTWNIQHGCDWERSRPQGPKNVNNFLMTVRPLSWACGHGTEMLLIKKNYFWPDYSPIYSDMTVQRNVPRFCTRSICGWSLFRPLWLIWNLIGLTNGGRNVERYPENSRRWLYVAVINP